MLHSVPPVESWLQLSMLRLLVGVSQTGSLSGSARAAGIAQSNASRSLKTLERRLGYPLLIRSTSGSTLTQEGKLTVEWAREVLDALDRLVLGADALANTKQTELTILASMTVAEHLLPGWIGSFRAVYPELHSKLKVMNSADVLEAVEADQGELGFVETPEVPSSIASATVWTDELVVVVGAHHPWADPMVELTADQLAKTELIEREEGSGTRAFLDLFIGDDRPEPLVEFNSNFAICQAVIEGIGAAVLSRMAVQGHLRTGQLVLVPLRDRRLERSLRAVWQKRVALSEGAREFLRVVRGDSQADNRSRR